MEAKTGLWLFFIGLLIVVGLVYFFGPSKPIGITAWVGAFFLFVLGIFLTPRTKTALDIGYELRLKEEKRKQKKKWWFSR